MGNNSTTPTVYDRLGAELHSILPVHKMCPADVAAAMASAIVRENTVYGTDPPLLQRYARIVVAQYTVGDPQLFDQIVDEMAMQLDRTTIDQYDGTASAAY